MGGRDHSCEVCGQGGFNDPDGECECLKVVSIEEYYEALAERDRLAEALQEVLRYIRADDEPTKHRRMGMACGVDACILCLAEAVTREALASLEQKED